MKIFIYFLFLINIFSFNLYCEVLNGIDVLEENGFAELKSKNVGVIVNHTSVDKKGRHLVDLLIENNINLRAIFSCEHGFKGDIEGGKNIEDSNYRNIPVYSLYGKTKRPSPQMLKGIDTLVFDIQDVGARFYTYFTSMAYAMEEALKNNIEFIVLDRPNPVSSIIEGPVLDDDIEAFTAYFKVPVRHSLTAIEMAGFYKKAKLFNLNLKLIKMKGYKKEMFYDDTGLLWINPSPNIKNLNAAILYSGIGCFEATNVSVGRGTEKPFELFCAPWLDNKKISDQLNRKNISGVEFYAFDVKPEYDLYKSTWCKAVGIKIKNKRDVRSFDIFVNAIYLINKYHPENLYINEVEIAKMVGSRKFYEMLKSNKKPEEILDYLQKSTLKFKEYIKKEKIYLYD